MWPWGQKTGQSTPIQTKQPEKPAISRMGFEDIDDCWRLDHICFQGSEAYDRDTFHYLLSHINGVHYKVIDSDGEMIAFVIGMVEPDLMGHVVALGVDPNSRGKGYGKRLMHTVEHSFYMHGVRSIRLEVRTENEIAQKLYLSIGYQIVRRLPKYYSNGDDGYLMIKPLTE
jgi:ribosomal-protein-alanine N-acetyltransferase